MRPGYRRAIVGGMPDPRSSRLGRSGRALGSLGRSLGGPTFELITAPPLARGGARVATQAARLWGRVLGGSERTEGELHVITGLPTWAFGRGGTTVGAAYLTRASDAPAVLEHEDVHRRQWERYGLWFIAMYLAAGQNPHSNRFEIEAGLEKGGYLPKRGLPSHGRDRPTGASGHDRS
jgi:hypothetical protein